MTLTFSSCDNDDDNDTTIPTIQALKPILLKEMVNLQLAIAAKQLDYNKQMNYMQH